MATARSPLSGSRSVSGADRTLSGSGSDCVSCRHKAEIAAIYLETNRNNRLRHSLASPGFSCGTLRRQTRCPVSGTLESPFLVASRWEINATAKLRIAPIATPKRVRRLRDATLNRQRLARRNEPLSMQPSCDQRIKKARPRPGWTLVK
jgi:hypothetical protein